MANGDQNTGLSRKEVEAIFKDTVTSLIGRLNETIKAVGSEGGDPFDIAQDKETLRELRAISKEISRETGIVSRLKEKIIAGEAKQRDIINAQNKLTLLSSRYAEISATASFDRLKNENKIAETLEEVNTENQKAAALTKQLGKVVEDNKNKINIFATAVGGLGKLLENIGFANPFAKLAEDLPNAQSALDIFGKELESQGKDLDNLDKKDQKRLNKLKEEADAYTQIGKALDETTKLSNLLTISAGGLAASIGKVNVEATEFRRLIGSQVNLQADLNLDLITAVDLISTQVALTEQLGLNAQAAFSPETIQEIAELTKLFGLSAESAGNLALFSEVAGNNLNQQTEALFKAIPAELNRRQIFEDIGQISAEIALRFQGNIVALGKAAAKAKQLGLNLQQVDQIADGLLNIEQSITAEFEAELLTGKQLNLERARLFALTNDYNGLLNEIGNNEEIIATFATGNRIQQEAIAAAIGLSVPDLAKAVFLQQRAEGASLGQAAAVADIGLESAKQLSAQQSIQASLQSISQSLAPVLEGFAAILSNTTGLALTLGVITGTYALRLIKMFQTSAVYAALFAKEMKLAAISTALTSIGLTPLRAALILGTMAGGYVALKNIFADDMVSQGYGKRTLLTPEGSIQLNNDDTVIAGTRLGRNAGLSRGDIKAIASAVRDGASQANINLDGSKVSSRLQVPNVINQRQYSI
jgi:hypothetical protein